MGQPGPDSQGVGEADYLPGSADGSVDTAEESLAEVGHPGPSSQGVGEADYTTPDVVADAEPATLGGSHSDVGHPGPDSQGIGEAEYTEAEITTADDVLAESSADTTADAEYVAPSEGYVDQDTPPADADSHWGAAAGAGAAGAGAVAAGSALSRDDDATWTDSTSDATSTDSTTTDAGWTDTTSDATSTDSTTTDAGWTDTTSDATDTDGTTGTDGSSGGDYGYDEAHSGAAAAGGFGEGPYGPGSATPADDGSGPQGWAVKGNAGSMLFHNEESPSFTATRAEVWFESEEAAKAAGFAHWDRKRR